MNIKADERDTENKITMCHQLANKLQPNIILHKLYLNLFMFYDTRYFPLVFKYLQILEYILMLLITIFFYALNIFYDLSE